MSPVGLGNTTRISTGYAQITVVDVSKIMSTIRVEIVNGWNEIWQHIQWPKQKQKGIKGN